MDKKYNIMILSGGFDPCHFAHCKLFKHAKELADTVIVGLNSDAWLIRKKGKPFMIFDERRIILESIKYIDRVWEMNDNDGTACDIIRKVHGLFVGPATQAGLSLKIAFGNGGDRSAKDKLPSAEAKLCEELGISMEFGIGGHEKLQSSSWLINNARNN